MKKILIIIFIIIQTSSASAQSKPVFSDRFIYNVAIENHLPVKTFASIYSYGVGISASIDYFIFKRLSVNFNPAFIVYFYNLNSVAVSGSTGYFTMQGGVRYFFADKVYVIGETGVGMKVSKFGKETAFAIEEGGGIILKKRFDIRLNYLNIQTSTLSPKAIGLRLAYIFGK